MHPPKLCSYDGLAAAMLLVTICCGNVSAQVVEFIFADSMETSLAVVYRHSQLALRDPHVFADVPVFGCLDFTDTPIPVAGVSFNGQLADLITADMDGDNLLDLSILLGLDRFDFSGAGQMATTVNGACGVPFPPVDCAIQPPFDVSTATTNIASGLCLQAIAGTTSGYSPAVPVIQDTCWFSAPRDSVTMLGEVLLTLLNAQLGFGWSLDGSQLVPGLNRGFLRETDADNTPLPADLPLIGGQPLSSILAGGQGSCAPGDDRDILAGETGWWFYLEVTSEQVMFTR